MPVGCRWVDETKLDRVITDAEHDRDPRGRRFRGDRSVWAAGCGDDGHAMADEETSHLLKAPK
jgi:hypothetical protein